MGKGENVLFLYLPLATKNWNLPLATKHWNLSKATKHWSLSRPPNIGTFHWPPSWDLFSPPFSFSLKGQIRIIGSSIFGRTILNSNLEKYLFSQPFLVGKEWLLLVDGKEKESRMDVCNSFERMEVSRDNVGSLKS